MSDSEKLNTWGAGSGEAPSPGPSALPNDISRCNGELDGRACVKRDTCRRYLEAARLTPWTWWIHPQIPGPCIYHLPTAERSDAPEARPAPEGPQ